MVWVLIKDRFIGNLTSVHKATGTRPIIIFAFAHQACVEPIDMFRNESDRDIAFNNIVAQISHGEKFIDTTKIIDNRKD